MLLGQYHVFYVRIEWELWVKKAISQDFGWNIELISNTGVCILHSRSLTSE